MRKIILASKSPRRKELLERIGLNFEIIPAQIEEKVEYPTQEAVEKVAFDKAKDIAENYTKSALIIGSDTIVICNEEILEKPKNRQDAYRMLKMLSNNKHRVISGIAIIDTENGNSITDSVVSEVYFKELSEEEINHYLDTDEPYDKAGSYGIQGLGCLFIKSINGCYNNIMGISTYKLAQMLEKMGVKIL
ncbi:MAG: Maf family protein [Candidatus Gastranaerophilales bacterium]|nr:Maf family protein [Candidatus Gastranaerophilales bacterium]